MKFYDRLKLLQELKRIHRNIKKSNIVREKQKCTYSNVFFIRKFQYEAISDFGVVFL